MKWDVLLDIPPKDWGSSGSHTLLLLCVSLLPFKILKYSESISQQEFFTVLINFVEGFLFYFLYIVVLDSSSRKLPRPLPKPDTIWFSFDLTFVSNIEQLCLWWGRLRADYLGEAGLKEEEKHLVLNIKIFQNAVLKHFKIQLIESFWKIMGILSSIFLGIFRGTQGCPSFEDLS